MKIVAQVPMITPNIIAKMKLRSESAPRKKMLSNTNSVEPEVMIVRPNVELIDELMMSKKFFLG